MKTIKAKRIDETQGLMEMTKPHTDETGKVWPKGTQYQPSSFGLDGNSPYQNVTIKGEHVTFIFKQKP